MSTGHFHNTIFYIIPHADDWQLFMNPDACLDINHTQNKIVFIVTTAGDAGFGEGFWRAREEGMKASVLYCMKAGEYINTTESKKQVFDKKLTTWSVNNVVCYFLRLPDGGVTGEGFKENTYCTLQRLENGTVELLTALDNSLALKSWSCFITLLSQIVLVESGKVEGKTILKFLDPDAQNNPLDHADHQSTGRAILSINNLPACSEIVYKGYGNSCEQSLTPDEIFWKSGIFAAYETTVFARTGYSTLAENIHLYQKWILARPEFRKVERM